jgi:DNA gyrase subunit B
MPAKLKDCHSDDMERTELFIIEGDSAAGTVHKARDSDFQAYMPIRGKILNTWRAKESDMLKNQECAAIITAMGGGSGKSFDLSSIRYGKFIILADADVDGSHIRCLLLTLCYRYMYPLLAAGRVYAAMPPLFGIEVVGDRKAGKTFVFSDEERDKEVAKLEKAGKKIKQPVMRYKGLGEMSKEELHDTTMDIRQRTLRRVTMADAQAAEAMFELLMGNDVPPRKDYIIENSTLLDLDALDF